MKAFIYSYRGFILGLVVLGMLAFTAARYDIYRLRPNPAPGQVVGNNNGFWGAVDGGSAAGIFVDVVLDSTNTSGRVTVPVAIYDSYIPVITMIDSTGIHAAVKSVSDSAFVIQFHRADTLLKSRNVEFIYLLKQF